MRVALKRIAFVGVMPAMLAAIATAGPAQADPFSFTAGDLVVSVEGNGSGTASGGASATGNTGGSAGIYQDNQAAPLSLYEFTTTGTNQTPVGSLALPQTTTPGGNYAVSGEYGSSSEGTLQLTGNGEYLTIMGYGVNAATYNSSQDLNGNGTALAQSCSLSSCGSSAVSRVIAEIGANGSVNSTTALYNVFNENNPRSVYSANGSTFYISGQGDHDDTGGVFYVNGVGSGATATPITGIDTNSKSNGSYNQDTRDVQIVNGTLTVSTDSTEGTASKGFDIDRIGTLGTPGSPPTTTLNQQPTALSGINGEITLSNGNGNSINHSTGGAWLSPEDFFYANSTTLYVADSGDPKNGNGGDATNGPSDGGLQKWSLVSGTWTLDYTLNLGLDLVNYATAGCAVDTASLSENTSCTTGLEGLTGELVGNDVELFATTYTLGDDNASYLYGIIDVLDDTAASQVTGENFTQLAEAPADSNFKGVAFAPIAAPEPWSLTLLVPGLAGLGFLEWRRRVSRAFFG
jgi:hypothetical protein